MESSLKNKHKELKCWEAVYLLLEHKCDKIEITCEFAESGWANFLGIGDDIDKDSFRIAITPDTQKWIDMLPKEGITVDDIDNLLVVTPDELDELADKPTNDDGVKEIVDMVFKKCEHKFGGVVEFCIKCGIEK